MLSTALNHIVFLAQYFTQHLEVVPEKIKDLSTCIGVFLYFYLSIERVYFIHLSIYESFF